MIPAVQTRSPLINVRIDRRLVAVLGCWLAAGRGLTAAPALVWSATWNGASSGADHAFGIAVGSCGIVHAYGADIPAGNSDGLLRSFTADGGFLGEARYAGIASGSAEGRDVAVDPSGNIYVSGYETVAGEGANWFVVKYDPAFTVVWTRSFNGPPNGDDYGTVVGVDSSGEVTAAGSVERADLGQGYDWMVRHYDGSGNPVWSRTYNHATDNAVDGTTELAIDGAGNPIVVGIVHQAGWAIWRIEKYDRATGATVWSRTYQPAPTSTDGWPQGVTVDAAGNVYVVGHEITGSWPNYDWHVAKFGPAGDLLWSTMYASSGGLEDHAQDVVVLADGTVVVGGGVGVAGQGRNWMIRAYTPSGGLAWTLTWNGAANANDQIEGLGVDPCGNLYVGGWEFVSGQANNWLVRRYGTAEITGCPATCGPAVPPPPPPDDEPAGSVRIVGGVRGYINAKRGEQAVFLTQPTGAGEVRARIYDRAGRLRRTLTAVSTGGTAAVVLRWDCRDEEGGEVPPGIYPVIIEGPGLNYRNKLAVLR